MEHIDFCSIVMLLSHKNMILMVNKGSISAHLNVFVMLQYSLLHTSGVMHSNPSAVKNVHAWELANIYCFLANKFVYSTWLPLDYTYMYRCFWYRARKRTCLYAWLDKNFEFHHLRKLDYCFLFNQYKYNLSKLRTVY